MNGVTSAMWFEGWGNDLSNTWVGHAETVKYTTYGARHAQRHCAKVVHGWDVKCFF